MTQDDVVIVRSMTMEEFEALPDFRHRATSQQRLAVEALVPGEVAIITHINENCKGNASRCSTRSMINHVRRKGEHTYMTRHLEDGNVAVACIAKERQE